LAKRASVHRHIITQPQALVAGYDDRPDETQSYPDRLARLVGGQRRTTFPSPLGLADVDPTLLTAGKERLVQQVLENLLTGRILTGAAP